MSFDQMTDIEIVTYIQDMNKWNKLLIVIGVLSLPIGVGVVLIIYAYLRLFRSVKAQRYLANRQRSSTTNSMNQCRSCKEWMDSTVKFCNSCGNQLIMEGVSA